ncbi:MAG: 3-phosphoshikimate 1-carboxyvinyltransferase [Peptostreptococcus sp.]|uniref:3-phosphoshikimate 1-carboxyvinyltransferase n=1 Tax=Peptostreptococcus sp. TaxID=1262 RepID=UPI002FC61C61
MDIKITPSKLSGKLKLPPSKSMAHRHIICASLANGVSEISNIAYSQDILASIDAMKALGAKFDMGKDSIKVYGIGDKIDLLDGSRDAASEIRKGRVSEAGREKVKINCRESGSTIRFLLPILTMFNKNFQIKAEGRLLKRPMDPYFEIFDREGISYSKDQESISIEGGKIFKSDKFYMDGRVSSQFISGMMFLLALLDHDSEIIIKNKLESKSYVDLTIDCLSKYNIKVENINYKTFKVAGNQKYASRDSYVEGDYSQAAFFAVANALGNEVDLTGVFEESLQGDRKILDIVRKFGANVRFLDESDEKKLSSKEKITDTKNFSSEGKAINKKKLSVKDKHNDKKEYGKKLIVREENRKAYSFDGSDVPDIVPIVALLASLSSGKTIIKNISRLRIKESDRIESVCSELEKLGADIRSGEDYIEINGVKELEGNVVVDSHKDHRIAMMLAIAASVCKEEIIIKNADSVSKSFPDFWEKYKKLGGIYECDLG